MTGESSSQSPNKKTLTGPARIAVIAVPFILSEYHFNVAARTVISLLAHRTDHTLDLIAIVNGIRTGQPHLDWFRNSFNVCEINDRNILARAWNQLRHFKL